MKIAKSDESSLLIALTEALQKAQLTWYGYVQLGSEFDDGIKSSLEEDFSKRLYSHLDDGGLESLIQREVLRTFHEEGLSLPAKDQKKLLASYKPFSDPLKFARRLTSCVKSLPFQYELIIRACNALAPAFGKEAPSLKVSDRMRLVPGSEVSSFATSTGDPSVDEIFLNFNSKDPALREIDSSALYFVYRTSGLVSDRTKPKPFADFYDDLRAFYGAAVSFKIFHSFAAQAHRSSVAMLANMLDGEKREFRHCEVADTDLAECAAFMTTKATDERVKNGEGLETIFAPVIQLFGSGESQRLKTAAIWLLRAHRTPNGMDQILDSTIAVEVLLGDREASDRIGLAKLMANRCAYSLGRSASERKELFEFFTRFYKVRSDIVHSGRMKLSEDEAEVVHKGTTLASRILRHETEIG